MNSTTFSINTLSDEDTLYLENVMIDLRTYVNSLHTCSHKKTVLLFPPVNNFRRFLIHHLVDNTFRKEKLSTLSVGSLYARRTVVYPSVLKPMEEKCTDVISERKSTVTKKINALPIYRPPALRNNEVANSCRKERKTRKPDIQIYVPRGRRLFTGSAGENHDDDNNTGPISSNSKPLNAEGLHTPKKQKIISTSCSPKKSKNDDSDPSLSECSSVIDVPIKKSEDDPSFENIVELDRVQIESVQEKLDIEEIQIVEKLAADVTSTKGQELNESNHAAPCTDKVKSPVDEYTFEENISTISSSCDDTVVTNETSATSDASKEKYTDATVPDVNISNCEKYQTKQNLNDERMDMFPTEDTQLNDHQKQDLKVASTSPNKSLCDESKTSTSWSTKENFALTVSDCEWDELYDDDGEFVDKSLINELMTAIGKVSVQHAAQDYKAFQTAEERTSDGGCVVEIHGFPAEFKTDDLFSVFASYRTDPGFQIVWVDDTHALAVFSNPALADEVLNTELPFVKTRPIKNAIPKSRMKAQNLIQPPVSRPKTCVSLARRLVSGHLGMKINVTDQQKAAERKILSDAREKRRLIAKQRQDAWEGTS